MKITTEEDYPGAPRNLQITLISPDSFNIVWEEPSSPNGEITGYKYRITGRPNDDSQNQGDIARPLIALGMSCHIDNIILLINS